MKSFFGLLVSAFAQLQSKVPSTLQPALQFVHSTSHLKCNPHLKPHTSQSAGEMSAQSAHPPLFEPNQS